MKKEKTKILITLPMSLKEELNKEAESEFRSLNNYMLTTLLNRKDIKRK